MFRTIVKAVVNYLVGTLIGRLMMYGLVAMLGMFLSPVAATVVAFVAVVAIFLFNERFNRFVNGIVKLIMACFDVIVTWVNSKFTVRTYRTA